MDTTIRWRDDSDAEADEEFLTLLLEGTRLVEAGDFPQARARLEQALKLRPQNEKCRNLLGQTYFKAGRLDDAAYLYQQLIAEYPEEPTLRFNLALVLLKTGDLAGVRRELERVVALRPAHLKAHGYLAHVQERLGDLLAARNSFARAGNDKQVALLEEKLRAAGIPFGPAPSPAQETSLPSAPPPAVLVEPEVPVAAAEEPVAALEPPAAPVEPEAPVAATEVAVVTPEPPAVLVEPEVPVAAAEVPVATLEPPAVPVEPETPVAAAEVPVVTPEFPAVPVEPEVPVAATEVPVVTPEPPALPVEPEATWDQLSALAPPTEVSPPAEVEGAEASLPPPDPAAVLSAWAMQSDGGESAPEPEPGAGAAAAWVQADPAGETSPVTPVEPAPTAEPTVSDPWPRDSLPAAPAEFPPLEPPSPDSLPPLPPEAMVSVPPPGGSESGLPAEGWGGTSSRGDVAAVHHPPLWPSMGPEAAWPRGDANRPVLERGLRGSLTGPWTLARWAGDRAPVRAEHPFAVVGEGLLGLPVLGEVLVRAGVVTCAHGGATGTPLQLKGVAGAVLSCKGEGELVLAVGDLHVSILGLRSEVVTVVADALLGSAGALAHELTVLPTGPEGRGEPAVQLAGLGTVALCSPSPLVAVQTSPGAPLVVATSRLCAWAGPPGFEPASAVGGDEPGWGGSMVAFSGLGVVFMSARPRGPG
jgi:hypothetical protein